jgi:glutaredoxin
VTRLWLAILILVAASASPALAQVYRWIDEEGRVRYTDTQPPPNAKQVQKKRVGVTPADRSRAAAKELAIATERFPLRLYSSPTCAEACVAARAALNQRAAPFQEIQVWDAESNEELKKATGGNEVPVLVVGARPPIKGFEKAEYDNALDAAGYPKRGELPASTEAAPPPPAGYVPPKERAESATPPPAK